MPDSVTITREWFELLEGLPTVQSRWNVLYAVAGFAFDGRVPDGLDALEKSVFMNIKPKIQNRKRVAHCYAKRKKKPLESALDSALESNAKTLESTLESNGELFSSNQHINNTFKPSSSLSNDKVCFPHDGKTKKRSVFKVPTLEDVEAYCRSRRNAVNPQQFMAHYEANGWMVGKNKMKDWQAAVRYWEQKMYQDRKSERQKRDYSGI